MNLSVLLTWLLMRLSWIDCSIEEVRERQYSSENEIVLIPEENNICDGKIDFLKDKDKEVKDRRDRIDIKARTLLTLTSLLLGLVSSATSITSARSIGIWSVFPLAFLFLTIFLLTIYFGIDRIQTTDYNYVLFDSSDNSAKRLYCNDLIRAQVFNGQVTDFMIDLYRSALRYFSLAMLLLMFFGIGNIAFTDKFFVAKKDEIRINLMHEFFILKEAFKDGLLNSSEHL